MNNNSIFDARKTPVRLSALVLIFALLLGFFGIISLNTNETFAEVATHSPNYSGTGANDLAQNQFMVDTAPKTGNADYKYRPSTTVSGVTTDYMYEGSWKDYLNTQWREQCLSSFSWTLRTAMVSNVSPAWGGTSTTTGLTSTGSAGSQANPMMQPYLNGSTYEIWSVEQLKYVLDLAATTLTGKTVKLMRSLDMNGSQYAWSYAHNGLLGNFTLDGGGHTIYNLGVNDTSGVGVTDTSSAADIAKLTNKGALIFGLAATGTSAVKNITIDSAKMVKQATGYWTSTANSNGGFSIFGIFATDSSTNRTVEKVYIKNSLMFSNTVTNNGTAFLCQSAGSQSTVRNTFINCGVENSYVYGMNHVSAMVSFIGGSKFQRCYSTDSIVVSMGYHSGGLL